MFFNTSQGSETLPIWRVNPPITIPVGSWTRRQWQVIMVEYTPLLRSRRILKAMPWE
jgi:hypothetical protein